MKIKSVLVGMLPVIGFVIIWESIAQLNLVPKYIFPSFSAVMIEFYHLAVSGVLLDNLLSSLFRVLAGFLLGSTAGIVVGIGMGSKESVNKSFHPILVSFIPFPPSAGRHC